VRYAFIKAESMQHCVRTLCRMMRVHPSGYYAWLRAPESTRCREDRELLGHIECVFRTNVTDRSGIVTGENGIVTDRSGNVTERTEEAVTGCV
jgi:hypothetical protein